MSAPTPIRSPSYPIIPLGDAIERVGKIEKLYRLSQVDREAAAKLIGYSGLSGPANKSLAALAQYGLVERAGKGEMRVTQRAKAILYPDSDDEHREQLRSAALEPPLFRELQDRWPNIIPPPDGVASYLSRKGFNQTAIRPAVRAYRDTLLFLEEAGASESHGKEESDLTDRGREGGNGATYGKAQVGDLVDYESGGAIANPEPMRVRALSEDQAWVFVDDSEAGLEMDQVIVRERPEGATTDKQRPMLPLPKQADDLKAGTRRAVFPLDEGDVALTFPEGMSAEGLNELSAYLDIFLKKEVKKADA